jgi:ParB family transcriptional regulator, chromosome partitioning protein
MSSKKPALGRGLSALLDGTSSNETYPSKSSNIESVPSNLEEGSTNLISIKNIEANPFQPRTHFEKEALEELTNSIKEHGVIQPITVRKIGQNRFQIISGERRFRASQNAGLTEIPVYVRVADDQTMLEMAIIENVQRKDLNAIEIALSYQRLIDECNITQEQVGDRVSKSRASVTNYLRLLNLPDEIQAGIRDEKISMGHARALLGFENESDKIKVYRNILDSNLSVRKVEELAKQSKEPKTAKPTTKKTTIPLSILKVKDNLAFHLNTKINIDKDFSGKGKIVINFEDEAHLQRIIEALDN